MDPSFLQSQSFVFVTILVQNDDIVVFSIVYIDPIMLGNRIIGVFVVIFDVRFMSSKSIVHGLRSFSNVFFVAA